LELYKPANIFY